MTIERYDKEVSEIKTADPTNVFLPELLKGHTLVREVYLTQAWRILRQKLPNYTSKKEVVTDDRQQATGEVQPSILNAQPLIIRRGEVWNNLMRDKSRVRDAMHQMRRENLLTAKTQADRKMWMERLDGLQEELAAINHQKRVFEKTGKLPIIASQQATGDNASSEDIDQPLPSDPLSIFKALNVARASVSYLKKEIGKLSPTLLTDAKHPARPKWERWEKDLKRWETRKTKLENLIKQMDDGENS